MALEIERKFLVNRPFDDIIREAESGHYEVGLIEQAYFRDTGGWAIRVRQITDRDGWPHRAYLTMKRRVSELTSVEIEEEISLQGFDEALSHCGPVLRKRRHDIYDHVNTWSLDLFLNPELKGLVLAEIELKSEEQGYAIPDWLGEEVTNDPEYRNFRLALRLNADRPDS